MSLNQFQAILVSIITSPQDYHAFLQDRRKFCIEKKLSQKEIEMLIGIDEIGLQQYVLAVQSKRGRKPTILRLIKNFWYGLFVT